jgi:hypothetical protein
MAHESNGSIPLARTVTVAATPTLPDVLADAIARGEQARLRVLRYLMTVTLCVSLAAVWVAITQNDRVEVGAGAPDVAAAGASATHASASPPKATVPTATTAPSTEGTTRPAAGRSTHPAPRVQPSPTWLSGQGHWNKPTFSGLGPSAYDSDEARAALIRALNRYEGDPKWFGAYASPSAIMLRDELQALRHAAGASREWSIHLPTTPMNPASAPATTALTATPAPPTGRPALDEQVSALGRRITQLDAAVHREAGSTYRAYVVRQNAATVLHDWELVVRTGRIRNGSVSVTVTDASGATLLEGQSLSVRGRHQEPDLTFEHGSRQYRLAVDYMLQRRFARDYIGLSVATTPIEPESHSAQREPR